MTNRITDITPLTSTPGHIKALLILLFIAVVVFLAAMWFIIPFILDHSGWPELIIGAITVAALGAYGIGQRIRATRILNCDHKYIGDYCPKCTNVFKYKPNKNK